MLRGEGESSPELSDPAKSRLLDQYLERRVLLAEADARGIEVTDEELKRALARSLPPGRRDRPGDAERMRASLRVEKLLREVVSRSMQVSPEEEKRFFEEHQEAFRSPTVLVLRQILLDDRARADALREELAGTSGRFADAARQESLSPDRGELRPYSSEDLPREVVLALENVKPGQVSPVVELPPHFVFFLVEEIRAARSLPLEEARPRIRARLREAHGNGVVVSLLTDLKEKLGVKLYEENLPFQYVREDPA